MFVDGYRTHHRPGILFVGIIGERLLRSGWLSTRLLLSAHVRIWLGRDEIFKSYDLPAAPSSGFFFALNKNEDS